MTKFFASFINTCLSAVIWLNFLPINVTCLDINKYLEQNSITSTPKCEEQKSYFLQSLVEEDTWAIQSNYFLIQIC